MSEMLDVLDEKGNFTGIQEDRKVIHDNGLWHRGVVLFLVNSKNEVLLQRRSANKKLWPNMLDVSAGGHASAGEFGFEAAIRETFEELGVKIEKEQLVFLGCTISEIARGGMQDNMFNEYYVANCDLNAESVKLQTEEVSEVKFVSISQLKQMMIDGYRELTPKIEAYEFLIKFLEKADK